MGCKRQIRDSIIISLIIFVLSCWATLEPAEAANRIEPIKVREAIKIDGDLLEAVWGQDPLPTTFVSFSPKFGNELGQKTHVWAAYDSDTLYFAFKCFDTEPDRIKTSICKRDNNSRDDWVGVIIDALGNKQTSYEFYVNPSGIQADCLNSAVSGYDMSPDFVWHSAGKLVEDGYQVEIAIPLQSIRFKSGSNVVMGLMFMRNISRLGTMASWPAFEPGQTQFNFLADTVYKNIKNKLYLEVLPNFTYSRTSDRVSQDDWDNYSDTNAGVSLKYGITSSIVSEATIKPDFSQVESDAFQVEINRRYPIFYSEKRPFFMEGTDIFDLGLVQNGMMLSAVHTRNIIDPSWAFKVSGSSGRASFAVMAANDQAPGARIGWEGNPDYGRDAFWGIARFKMSLGSDNSIGVLFSGRHFGINKNNVGGIDLQYRFLKNLRLNSSFLVSHTYQSGLSYNVWSSGVNLMLQYSTRALDAWGTYEFYGPHFNMESAFLMRTDFERGSVYAGPNIYIKSKSFPWLQKIQPHAQASLLHDHSTGMDDKSALLGVDMHFTRQGFLRFRYRDETEGWEGQLFNPRYFYIYGSAQFLKWMYMYGSVTFGDQIYYDYLDPFLGDGDRYSLGVILQPNINLSLNLDYSYNRLSRKDDSLAYKVNIYNLHATYQFNKYFFIRAVVRYNDLQDKLLTDLLASFTLIPGTVIHLGYGTLHESKRWEGDRWISGADSLLNTRKGLFFKVSYLWRL